jgi:membrane protease YdiL (CAAX protease family)
MTAPVLSRLFVREGRLRSGWRIAIYLAGYFAGLIAIQVPIVGAYVARLLAQGASLPDLMDALQPERLPMWLYLALKVGEMVVLLPWTFLLCRLLDRRPLAGLGLHLDRRMGRDLALGLALGAAQMGLIWGLEWAGGWIAVGTLDGRALAHALGQGGIALVLFVLVALGEELMFRGYLQTNLQDGTGLWTSLILSSALFSLFHGLNPNVSWIALLNIALAGGMLGYSRAKTGRLWLPMAYHFSWNLVQGPVLSLPVSGVHYGGLLAVVDRGTAPLLTGGAFGPEGGLIGTLVLVAAFPLLWLWGRRARGQR